jgi:CRP-like cAMP-binding protein
LQTSVKARRDIVKQSEETLRLLQQVELFQGVDPASLRMIAEGTIEQKFAVGEVIFREGEAGDRLFLLLTGTMRVYVERDGRLITYGIVQAGECFGEMALIEDAPRSASVRAEAPSCCLTLSKQDFMALISRYPHLALGIMKSLSQRLRRTNTRVQDYANYLAQGSRRETA